MKKTVLILGATGMVGSEVLSECLKNRHIGKVVVITRRATDIKHKKLVEIIHHDYFDYTNIKSMLKGISACFFCIGVYQNEISRDDFIRITHNMPLEAAKAVKKQSPNCAFVFLSSIGANARSTIRFAHWKGRTEQDLHNLKLKDLYCVRPGYMIPSISRLKPKFSEYFTRPIKPILEIIMPTYVITSNEVAKAMVHLALHPSEKTILNNTELKAIVHR